MNALAGLAAVGAVVALGGAARADPVNLLTRSHATLAVSSTVDSTVFLPEHLVDGDRGTAWSSAPGDHGAWIAFSVPADAHVAAIKLTVGFTTRDRFKQNLRIANVHVDHAGKRTDATLDPNSTALQTIPIDDDGGVYRITVDRTVPGTNKDRDEVVVSELEVAGRIDKPTASQRPRVIVGSLDVDCLHAVFPKARGGRLTPTEALRSVHYEEPLCVVDHGRSKSRDHSTTLALMHGDSAVDKVDVEFEDYGPELRFDGSVEFTELVLGTERALVVEERRSGQGEMTSMEHSIYTLYRIAAGKLDPVWTWESQRRAVEQWSESHACTLAVGAPAQPLPELVLTCEDGGTDVDGTSSPPTTTVTKLHWDGERYE